MQRRKFLALAGAAAIAPALPAPAIDTLAGYAEGVWTPAVTFDYSTGMALTRDVGVYRKMARELMVNGRILLRWSEAQDELVWTPANA